MSKKYMSIPLEEYKELEKFNNEMRKDNAVAVRNYDYGSLYGGGTGLHYMKPPHDNIEYITTDEAVLKLAEINKEITDEIIKLKELSVTTTVLHDDHVSLINEKEELKQMGYLQFKRWKKNLKKK